MIIKGKQILTNKEYNEIKELWEKAANVFQIGDDGHCLIVNTFDYDNFIQNAHKNCFKLITEIERLKRRERWFINHLANGGKWYCPMPDKHKCKFRNGDNCKAQNSDIRKKCWYKAVNLDIKEEDYAGAR